MLKIGVVIPNYNDSKYLIKTLDTIFKQTCKFDEVIYVDDFSTDNSLEIVENYSKEIRIYKNKKRSGCFACLNKGLMKSKSDFLLFLSSNDYIEKNLVEEFKKTVKEKSIGLWSALTNVSINDKKKYFLSPSPSLGNKNIKSNEIVNYLISNDIWFTGSTTFYNADELKKIGGFNEDFLGLSDLIASVTISSNNSIMFVPRFLATWRVHNDRLISNTYKNIQLEKVLKKIIKFLNEYKVNDKVVSLLLFKIFKNFYLSNIKKNNNVIDLLIKNKFNRLIINKSFNQHIIFKYLIILYTFVTELKLKSLIGHIKSRLFTLILSLKKKVIILWKKY